MSGTVIIVDDDQAVRDSLTSLFDAAGYTVESYPDAKTFLDAYEQDRPGCLVLDMKMPGMGGLELQEELTKREDRRPIIFLTAHGTVQLTVRALKNGAFDFLEKPADGGALLSLVDKALQRDANERRKVMDLELAKQRCDALTERERDILRLVISGNSNKDIAHQLGISHRTVELHRMRVMQKTGAQNVIELVEIARAAGFSINHAINGDSPTPDTR